MKIVLLRAIYLLAGGGVGGLGLIFAGYVSLASQIPYPIIVCSVAKVFVHLALISELFIRKIK